MLHLLLLLLPVVLGQPNNKPYPEPGSSRHLSYGQAPASFLAVATAIEDHKCGCLFVATSPQSYAFCLDPKSNPFQWSR